MKRRAVRHPGGPGLLQSAGRGGDVGPSGPIRNRPPSHGQNPPVPNPLDAITQQLTAGWQAAVASVLGPGQVLVGVLLIAAGLLLATGQLQRGARAGGRAALFAATRGAVK